MKKQVYRGLTALLVMGTTLAYGQGYDNNRRYDDRTYNSRSSRPDDERRNNDRDRAERDYRNDDFRDNGSRNNDYQRTDDRRDDDRSARDDRRDYDMRRRDDDRDRERSTDSDRYRSDNRTFRRYEDQDLQQAYDKGYDDGMGDVEKNERKERREDYKNFTFGLYGGLNSTRFDGEGVNGQNLSGRLGYQLGAYVRGGGRIYGQIGVEYLTSSSDFYRRADSTVSLNEVISNVDQQYIHIPAYIGVKLAQSPRGLSAVRLQVGAELATVTGNNSDFTFNNSTINGLANLGFDAGPLTVDFVYHYGFNNTIRDQAASSKPRILGVNVGVKF
ncbi:MAG: hypothetical protein H7Z72_20570 [Bacteroidetes bacterium]|nr:hypothetical protein [Fibrella sp.]